jgi:hypothetical protein
MPRNAADAKRLLARERQRRHYALKAQRKAIGRFVITEELANLLVWEGKITDADAMTTAGIERGADKILQEWLLSAAQKYF